MWGSSAGLLETSAAKTSRGPPTEHADTGRRYGHGATAEQRHGGACEGGAVLTSHRGTGSVDPVQIGRLDPQVRKNQRRTL